MSHAEGPGSAFEGESASRVSLFEDLYVTELGTVFEEQARSGGFLMIAGVDEVGRGCLAGPVVAAACILDLTKPLPDGLNDSKKVTPENRERISEELRENCIGYAIGQIEADEIDRINILEASKKAMIAAVEKLAPAADFVLIDAVQLKQLPLPQKAIIKGDSLSASIAAASILAKTYRDALMCQYHERFPVYGFASHKGYAATEHRNALKSHGPCEIHRMSFRGVLPNESQI